MKTYGKFAALVVVIVGTLIWLAAGGINESKTYYRTIEEISKMGSDAFGQRMRVTGDVVPGSIRRNGKEVSFVIAEKGKDLKLNVVYNGSEPLPDTFKAEAQAMADGKMQPNGVFHASSIAAKCPSKYEAKPSGKPVTQPFNRKASI